MEILKDFNNVLLKRREVKAIVEADSNLGFGNAAAIISEELKENQESIIIKNVLSNFGSGHFLIEAFIYASKEHKEKIEPKQKLKKKAGGK